MALGLHRPRSIPYCIVSFYSYETSLSSVYVDASNAREPVIQRLENWSEMDRRPMGVEEEFLLVDAETGRPRSVASTVLRIADALGKRGESHQSSRSAQPGGEVDGELWLEQLEVDTHPCETLRELDDELRRQRESAAQLAHAAGVEIAALATSPFPDEPSLTPKPRYRKLIEQFGATAHEQLVCGCHVHVQVEGDDEGVAVIDRIRRWAPALLAISANSPYWKGRDTGYSSFRSPVMERWPSAGFTQTFGSGAEYRRLVQAMLASGVIQDERMVYFGARLSRSYPTVEIRIGDVCQRRVDAVLFSALVRAVTETEIRAWAADPTPENGRVELYRMASWQAARHGVEGSLLHPHSGEPVPARTAIGVLLEHVKPVLREYGELDDVLEWTRDLLSRGTGARAQRIAYERGGLAEVVRAAVRMTNQ
jgi:glutamate---cysteine ligase / carboxylate-amine ligase